MFANDDRDDDVTPDFVAILAEIRRVDELRGYDHALPIGGVRNVATVNAAAEARRAYDADEKEGRATFLGALREEVAEAAAEDNPALAYREFAQIATVAARAMRALRRRAEEASTP